MFLCHGLISGFLVLIKAPENPNPQSPGLADYFDFEKSIVTFEKSIVTFESQMQTLDFGKSQNRGLVTSGICKLCLNQTKDKQEPLVPFLTGQFSNVRVSRQLIPGTNFQTDLYRRRL